MMRVIALLCLCSFSLFAAAQVPPAYQAIAFAKGVPPSVLWTIANLESNAKLTIGYFPWPWTLNVAGESLYFQTRDEACLQTLEAIDKHGAKRVDIGFTQNNWGYNGVHYFSHPCEALDPLRNLEAAAEILRKCYDSRRDWVQAAGCYHRPAGGEPAERYMRIFIKRWDGL